MTISIEPCDVSDSSTDSSDNTPHGRNQSPSPCSHPFAADWTGQQAIGWDHVIGDLFLPCGVLSEESLLLPLTSHGSMLIVDTSDFFIWRYAILC